MTSPVIADLDGNGSLEVIVANGPAVDILNGRDGRPLTCQSRPCTGVLALDAKSTISATPAIADANLDGQLDLFVGGGSGSPGTLFGWTGFSTRLGSDPGPFSPYAQPWPMFRGYATRDGRLR